VQRVRRKSRVQKQHSYDDEIKPGVGQGGQGVTTTLTTEGQGNSSVLEYFNNFSNKSLLHTY
jgi:hypothetical protein